MLINTIIRMVIVVAADDAEMPVAVTVRARIRAVRNNVSATLHNVITRFVFIIV